MGFSSTPSGIPGVLRGLSKDFMGSRRRSRGDSGVFHSISGDPRDVQEVLQKVSGAFKDVPRDAGVFRSVPEGVPLSFRGFYICSRGVPRGSKGFQKRSKSVPGSLEGASWGFESVARHFKSPGLF